MSVTNPNKQLLNSQPTRVKYQTVVLNSFRLVEAPYSTSTSEEDVSTSNILESSTYAEQPSLTTTTLNSTDLRMMSDSLLQQQQQQALSAENDQSGGGGECGGAEEENKNDDLTTANNSISSIRSVNDGDAKGRCRINSSSVMNCFEFLNSTALQQQQHRQHNISKKEPFFVWKNPFFSSFKMNRMNTFIYNINSFIIHII